MELCSIASGSSGNCICAGTDNCHVLIDAGISGKRIEAGLNSIDLKTAEMQGILVTHEHIDHIAGLGVLARRYGLPIYTTAGTRDAILQTKSVGKMDEDLFQVIEPGKEFSIGDLTIEPIPISHDAAEPVAYKMYQDGKSMAVMTDLGKYDDNIVRNQRITRIPKSQPYFKGVINLSNELSGQLLGQVLHDHFKHIVLGHLSKENNYPDLAYETVRLEVELGENPYKGDDFPMFVAKRDEVSQKIEF